MKAEWILAPVLAQVLLVILVYVLMGVRKAAAVKARQVDRQKAALDNRVWPPRVVQVNNNITNQFEAPVLFYVLCLSLLLLDAVSTAALVVATLFVASRYLHAWVHTHSNYVPVRMRLFLFGVLMLMILAGLAISALIGGAAG